MPASPIVGRPGETISWAMPFGQLPTVQAGAAISSPSVVVTVLTVGSTASPLTAASVAVAGSDVVALYSGFTNNVDYLVTVTVSATGGQTLVESGVAQGRA